MATSVNLKGASELKKYLSNYSAKVKKEVDDVLAGGAADMVRMAKQDAPIDLGMLRNGITFQRIAPLQYEVFSQVSYSPFIEFGTRGKVEIPAGLEEIAAQYRGMKGPGGFYEFANAILDWMKRKGIKAGTYSVATHRRQGNKQTKFEEDLALAEHIAYSILKNGIKPHPFFFHNYFKVANQIRKELQTILKNRATK